MTLKLIFLAPAPSGNFLMFSLGSTVLSSQALPGEPPLPSGKVDSRLPSAGLCFLPRSSAAVLTGYKLRGLAVTHARKCNYHFVLCASSFPGHVKKSRLLMGEIVCGFFVVFFILA